MWLIKDVPKHKAHEGKFCFDYLGLVVFIITMLCINVVITYGADFGWRRPAYSWSYRCLHHRDYCVR